MLTELDRVDRGDITSKSLHHEAGHLVPDISAIRVKLEGLIEVELQLPISNLDASAAMRVQRYAALTWLATARTCVSGSEASGCIMKFVPHAHAIECF